VAHRALLGTSRARILVLHDEEASMGHPSVSEPLFQKSIVAKTCAFCGAKFEILLTCAPHGEGDEPFDCDCPECGMQYEVQAALQPAVRLVAPRSDGKNDRYQETMF